ncbi:hypothetical protein M404DRAFT_544231 [Pisolithus tinctorius Marx 270]|uniref:Uncharacterized protein n=1 Tax=Pisolithus tinctorius Marx 270 TaxID=870435 RepID=A0A0C3PAH3_PISTI|nr:hypothetical protein M404DRAFT_544231 [Pisolithus tinctorius Marx 270]
MSGLVAARFKGFTRRQEINRERHVVVSKRSPCYLCITWLKAHPHFVRSSTCAQLFEKGNALTRRYTQQSLVVMYRGTGDAFETRLVGGFGTSRRLTK